MADIFLSYSHEDTSFKDRIVKDLETEGFSVWTDQDIEPGTPSWQETIAAQIELAACTIVLLSPRAKGSKWVGIEVSYSDTQDKMVLPVLIDGEEKASIPIGLLNRQYVDLRTQYQNNLPKLMNALKTLISHSKTAKKEWWEFLGNPKEGDDLLERIISASPALPKKEPTQTPPKDRLDVRADIISVLTAFYSRFLESEKATFGEVEATLTRNEIFVGVRLPIGLAHDGRRTMVDKLVKLGFVAGGLLEPLIFSAVNNPDNFSKSWANPGSDLLRIAEETIDVNLILGLSLEDIKIEAHF